MKKIVVIGPESSGKTTLVKLLANHYQTFWVSEYARPFLTTLSRPYVERDLLDIAKGQLAEEDRFAAKAEQFLFCDTDLITIRIWQQQKFGACYQWINQQIKERHYDAYLLCSPDIPWEEDPLRENRNNREALYNIYRKELLRLQKIVIPISGPLEDRFEQAKAFLDT